MPRNAPPALHSPHSVRIRSIGVVPLLGESPKGGWSFEIVPDRLDPRDRCCSHRRGHHRLWQRLHRWPAGTGGGEGS